jgi:hypothetical protein
MGQYTGFSAQACLVKIGVWVYKRKVWQIVERHGTIKQE